MGNMVITTDQDIVVPPEFPEKYHDALIRAADQCAVKKHMENPPPASTCRPRWQLRGNLSFQKKSRRPSFSMGPRLFRGPGKIRDVGHVLVVLLEDGTQVVEDTVEHARPEQKVRAGLSF